MAPIGESCYFPPLDKCLDGRHQLFSWKTAYIGLSQLGNILDDGSLKKHLTDHQTVHLLTRPFSPFSLPTSHSKSSFETKTSAINVSPSAHGRYDIKEIQEDTLWLSKEAKISEIEALRIAVLEWQTRPAQRMLRDSPHDESHDLRSTVGIGGSAASLRGSVLSRPPGLKQDTAKAFDSPEERRKRLSYIYLSERRYILKTSEHLIFNVLFEASLDAESDSTTSDGTKPYQTGWVREIGNQILTVWDLHGVVQGSGNNFIIDTVNAIQSRIDNLARGSGWFQEQEPQEHIEVAWGRNQILEMIHIMQIMLNLLDSSTQLTRTDALLAWFRFVSKYGFFEDFELSYDGFQGIYEAPLQSLTALISLALINLPEALVKVLQISTAAISAENPRGDAPYLLSPDGINEMNEILVNAAKNCLANASPAVLAWSVILQTIREYALMSRESKEIKQAQRAVEKFSDADTFDHDGGDRSWDRNSPHLQRRSSASSDTSQQSTLLENILDKIMDTTLDEDPISYLAKGAVDRSGVFDVVTSLAVDYCTYFTQDHNGKSGMTIRRMLLELVRAVLEWIDYQPTLILASLAVLTGNERYWDILNRPQGPSNAEPAMFFLNDSLLMQKLFQTALARFPYEALPFLKLCRALASCDAEGNEPLPAVWPFIETLDSLTCLVPTDFTAYEIVREDEEANYVQLTGNLGFLNDSSESTFAHTSKSTSSSSALMKVLPTSNSQELPVGTMGRVLSESRPLIVMWRYDYSPLAYLGQVLREFSIDGGSFSSSADIGETVSETIDLITLLISSAIRRQSGTNAATVQKAAQTILENASDGLDRNQDIVSVIFQIFENELHRRRNASEEANSMDILIRCIQFTYALLPTMPDRVWPFLGRSNLLGIHGLESQLSIIVASNEMVSGRYDFLLGAIRVFDALVDDAMAHAVSHKIPITAIKRFADKGNPGTGMSQTAMQKVIISFQRTMVDVFESTSNWKFVVQEERSEINTWICTIFQKILSYCFDIDDQSDIFRKLARPLAPAAEYLLNAFLSTSNSNLTVNPLLRILLDGATVSNSSLSVRGFQFWTSQVRAAICFTTGLIRVNSLLKRPQSHLQQEMFKATPILARVYAAHESYRLPIVDLFDALIRSNDSADQQPLSLLGHLGQDTASCFLEILSVVDKPFNDDCLAIGIWRLLSAVVSRHQQWFAILVLTGNTPRESFKDSGKTDGFPSQRAEALLTIALDGLSNIERLQPTNAIAILEFVACAADYWPWVLRTIEEHPHFLAAMLDFVAYPNPLQSSTKNTTSSKASTDYARLQMSSVVLDILAMYINRTQTQNLTFAKKLFPNLTFYIQYAVSVPGYNGSLHANLRRNFESKFPGCYLKEFKRTTVKRPQLGDSFYYDLEIAGKMLAFDSAWAGIRDQGFSEEMSRANINLSLVESQVNLLHSWKFLAVELCGVLGTDAKVRNLMASTILQCLHSNTRSNLPEYIFKQLTMSRAELSFTLLQRLVELKSSDGEVKNILPAAWDMLRAHETDVGLGLMGESADYYRLLLKILYLALQTHASGPSSPHLDSSRLKPKDEDATKMSSTKLALDIIGIVVARGFRSLTNVLHDGPTRISPADFALIIALLRTGLQVPGVEKHTAQLLSEFADNQTARCATALFSWADQIATDLDPIYGELSISFLLELSSIPALAESLAVEGILTQVSSTNLIRHLRQEKGTGPFDSPFRLYSIWSRGILPFLLNLLHAVGAPIAAEIAACLNSFPSQLARASSTFLDSSMSSANPTAGAITLSMVSEAHTLAVISTVLDRFREAGPSVAVNASQIEEPTWDRVQVKEDIDNLRRSKSALRERIFATNEKEEAWARQPPLSGASGALNRLEEKVVEELATVMTMLGGGESR